MAETAADPSRFPADLLYQAATLYYLENATQEQVARKLGTSRPTVSRLLAAARARGIVRIDVVAPEEHSRAGLAGELESALGIRAHVTASTTGVSIGPILAGGVAEALVEAGLQSGDALLVSSGVTIHAVAQQQLPALPGVVLAPTVGGADEPEEYYQTNELTRALAMKVHGSPALLYAPAVPSAPLRRMLLKDSSIQRVTSLWKTATAVLVGIGAPPNTRSTVPSVFPRNPGVLAHAVGDICSRPYAADGSPIAFPGSDRLMAMELDDLRATPHSIAVAVGEVKVPGIVAASSASYFNTLVTDLPTARLLVEHATGA